jgi:O-antigen ligase
MAERAVAAGSVSNQGFGSWSVYAGYWSRAPHLVLVLCAIVAVRIHEFFPGISVIKPVLTGSIGGMLLLYQRTHASVRKMLPESRIARVVFAYFAAIVATIPFALYQAGSFDQARAVFPAILLFSAFLLSPPTRENLDRLQFGFVVLLLFFAWYVQFFGSSWKGRLLSVSGSFDSNDIASLMSMGLPLSIGVMMRMKGSRERIGAALAVLALVLGVIATGSRGGFLALVAGILVFIVGLRGSARVVAPIFIAIAGALFWVTAPPQFRFRIQSLTHLENDYNMTTPEGRKAVWARGRGYIKQYPLLGVGAGNFYIADGQHKQGVGLTGKWSTAHNAYLQAYVELGIPGGTIYIIMLVTGAALAFRMWGPERRGRGRSPPVTLYRPEYLASMASYTAGAYFLSHAYFTPLFAVLGMIALSDRIIANEARGINLEAGTTQAVQVPTRLPGQRGGLAWTRGVVQAPARGGLFRSALGKPSSAAPPRSLPRRGMG